MSICRRADRSDADNGFLGRARHGSLTNSGQICQSACRSICRACRSATIRPGATDPHLRLRDQDTDGVAAEILFPNYGMALFAIDDVETQQESFKLYNDWCMASVRLIPSGFMRRRSCRSYDIKAGIKEMQRGHLRGQKGAMIWQVPDPTCVHI